MAGSSTADLQVLRSEPVDAGPAFYVDFAVPEAYLAAERILSLMPAPCEWIPVMAGELAAGGWGAWRCAEEREIELSQFERTAATSSAQRNAGSMRTGTHSTSSLSSATTYAWGQARS